QPVDHAGEGFGRLIVEERADFVRGGWKSGQVERGAADQSTLVGRRRGRQSLGFERSQQKRVDGGFHPSLVPYLGDPGLLRGDEGPEPLRLRARLRRFSSPRRAAFYPLDKNRDFRVFELARGRHPQPLVQLPNRADQQALFGLATDNRRTARTTLFKRFAVIQTKST